MSTGVRALLALLSLALCMMPVSAMAWSSRGHAAISLASYQQLQGKAKTRYANAAKLLYHTFHVQPDKAAMTGPQIPECRRKPALCFLVTWPDTVRKQPLRALFRQAGTQTPSELKAFAETGTATWHYHNRFLKKDISGFASTCQANNQGRLFERIAQLQRVLSKPLPEAQDAIVLAFWLHLVADAHQPLHTFTRVSRACDHDLGGNRSCVLKTRNGRCETSLHNLWDSGAGGFEHLLPLPLAVKSTTQQFTLKALFADHLELAKRVYLPADAYSSASYQSLVKRESEKQAGLAAVRIAQWLNRQ